MTQTNLAQCFCARNFRSNSMKRKIKIELLRISAPVDFMKFLRMHGILYLQFAKQGPKKLSLFASGTNIELHLLQPWLVDFVDRFTIL